MNNLLLSLVGSLGGNDAIAGLMAKAPPGESPPVTATSFLQILLQTLPGGQSPSPIAMLLGGTEPVQLPVAAKAEPDVVQPDTKEAAGDQPETPTTDLSALEAVLFALAFPVEQMPILQAGNATAQEGSDSVQASQATPVLGTGHEGPVNDLRAAVSASVMESADPVPALGPESALADLTARKIEARAPDPVEQLSSEKNAEIPAPETREGAAKIERLRMPMPQGQTALPVDTPEKTEAPTTKLPPPVPRVTAPRQEVPAMVVAESPSGAERAEPQSLQAGRELDRPVERPAVTQVSADDVPDAPVKVPTGDAKPDRPARPQEFAGLTFVLDRVTRAVPDQKPALEIAPMKSGESRQTERRGDHGTDSRQHNAERSPEQTLRVESPEKPVESGTVKKQVYSAEAEEPRPVAAEPRAMEPASEAGKAQTAATGNSVQAREPADPSASRHLLGTTQGHQSRDFSGTQGLKDASTLVAKMHLKLTEELSRSVMDQVVKHVVLQVQGETSEMRIRLDPPSLGEMQVTVRVDEGRVQAQIDVTQPAVRAALETNVSQLRQSLSDQGIDVHRIEVCASGSSMSRESNEGHGHRPRKREGGRQQGSMDGVDQYRGARMMGYNTIEMVM